jgi:hypothetical protein
LRAAILSCCLHNRSKPRKQLSELPPKSVAWATILQPAPKARNRAIGSVAIRGLRRAVVVRAPNAYGDFSPLRFAPLSTTTSCGSGRSRLNASTAERKEPCTDAKDWIRVPVVGRCENRDRHVRCEEPPDPCQPTERHRCGHQHRSPWEDRCANQKQDAVDFPIVTHGSTLTRAPRSDSTRLVPGDARITASLPGPANFAAVLRASLGNSRHACRRVGTTETNRETENQGSNTQHRYLLLASAKAPKTAKSYRPGSRRENRTTGV